MDAGREPISDDELLYRRISFSADPVLYHSDTGELSEQAFAPHRERDKTGLSIVRAKYKSIKEAARGAEGKKYFVAVLRASEVRGLGVEIEPRPDVPEGFDPAHAEFTTLNAANRKTNETLEKMEGLVRICLRVEGPFETPPS